MPGREHIINKRQDDNTSENRTAPVHRLRRDFMLQREECKYPRHSEEDERTGVHRARPFSHRPTGGWEGLAAPPLEAHAGDGDDIGGKEGCHAQRKDGVESDGGADVDKR